MVGVAKPIGINFARPIADRPMGLPLLGLFDTPDRVAFIKYSMEY